MIIKQLIKIGRFFYGIGIIAFGIEQIIIKDFRPEILPPFPAWAHRYSIFPILTGIALVFAGTVISGLIRLIKVSTKKICLFLGFCLLALVITCQLPYTLFISPGNISDWQSWIEPLEALACCGGAFVMAGSFSANDLRGDNFNFFELMLEKLIPVGRIFFSALMILFGCSHFIITDFVSAMIPKWFGAPLFWTYLCGLALICSGIAIIFKIRIRTVSFLLAILLFIFFIFVHVPLAVARPFGAEQNETVRALEALLFSGTALVIAFSNNTKKEIN